MGGPIPMAATLTHATLLLVMTLRSSGYIMTDLSFECHMWALEALARDPGECFQAPQVRLSMMECPQDALESGAPLLMMIIQTHHTRCSS